MSITERYVTSTGTDTYANSTNPVTPMSLTTALANMAAGDRINIKAGTYTRSADDTPTNDGSTTSPIILRGYTTTIGDATNGRLSGGALDTSMMPTIAYNAGFQYAGSGSTHVVFEALNLTFDIDANGLVLGSNNTVINCKAHNASTGGVSACAVVSGTTQCQLIDSDFSTASGGQHAVNMSATAAGLILGCRATCAPGNGIYIASGLVIVAHCTVYSCTTGIAVNSTTSNPMFLHNTVYGCTGDGIDVVTSSTTGQTFYGNHITDCGGYGVDWNTSTCQKRFTHNRTRDNTGGATNGGGDWVTGVSARNVTTDTGGASTDYVNAGSDFSLIAAAPGISRAPGYLMDIGGNGSPIVVGATAYVG